jgi:PTS system nitrogen regulatory IIA component
MIVEDFLTPPNVRIEERRLDKPALLRALSEGAAETLGLDAEDVLAEVQKREELGSTGIGQGIAIPHTRLADLSQTYGYVMRLQHPVDFDSMDGEPVDIVFFLLLPASPPKAHLNCLASAARVLRDPTVQSELRKAETKDDLYRAITRPVSHG